MTVDLSYIDRRERKVVLCRSEDEVAVFIDAVLLKYPQTFITKGGQIKAFNTHHDREGLCYRIERYENGMIDHGFDNRRFYTRDGYDVINFSDLLIKNDLGIIEFGFESREAAIAALL